MLKIGVKRRRTKAQISDDKEEEMLKIQQNEERIIKLAEKEEAVAEMQSKLWSYQQMH